jgi:hypothetical protein
MTTRKSDPWGTEDQFASVSDQERESDLKRSAELFQECVHELVGFEPIQLVIPSHSKEEALARFVPTLGFSRFIFEGWTRTILTTAKNAKVRAAIMDGILLGQNSMMLAFSEVVRYRAKKRTDGVAAARKRDRTVESIRRTACEFVDADYREYRKSHQRNFERYWDLERVRLHEELSSLNSAAAATLYRDADRTKFVKWKSMRKRIKAFKSPETSRGLLNKKAALTKK